MAREVRVILKRDDIEPGTLQLLDLKPHTSQRSPSQSYFPVGQTKYIRPPDRDTVAYTTVGAEVQVTSTVRGIAAYLAVNVDDGTGAAAAGTVTAATVLAGDTTTIGGVLFLAVAGARTSGADDFTVVGGNTAVAADLAAAVNDPANGIVTGGIGVTASPAVAIVTVTADVEGTAGNAITLVSSGATLAVSAATLLGGVDSDLNAAADNNTSQTDILTNLLAFGDVTSAAVTMDLTAVNGELTSGTLTAAQHLDVLDILAGREYVVPAGTVITTSSVFGPTGDFGFVAGSLRTIYSTSAFRVSFTGGYLSKLVRNDFNFNDVLSTSTNTNTEAVAVLADDGSLYVP